MEGLSSVPSVPEELTAAVAACFGTQLVSEALSSELRQSLPFATFARSEQVLGFTLDISVSPLARGEAKAL